MPKIKCIIPIMIICFLAACAPSEQAIQTAIAQTQAANPTDSPTNVPSLAVILGFVLEPLYEANCPSSCTTYERVNPWMTADVFDNGEFEIFGGSSDTQLFYTVITQAYGLDYTNWVADHLASLLQDPNATSSTSEKLCQTGSMGNFNIEICMMDFGNRVWITISPKG
jgi:hypothetical protein